MTPRLAQFSSTGTTGHVDDERQGKDGRQNHSVLLKTRVQEDQVTQAMWQKAASPLRGDCSLERRVRS